MDSINNAILESAGQGKGTAIAAFVIWALIELLKSSVLGDKVPKKAQPWIALALGQAYCVLLMVFNGTSWGAAFISGVISTIGAIGTQEFRQATNLNPPVLLIVVSFTMVGCAPGAGGKSPDYLGIATRVLKTSQGCLDGFLSRAEDRCSKEADPQACLKEAQDQWLRLQEDVAVIQERACDDPALKTQFAGVCE